MIFVMENIKYVEAKPGRIFIGRFEADQDLLESLNQFCKEKNIRLGLFSLIGAVRNVKLGYYDQEQKKYIGCVEIDNKLEITTCIGNISIRDDDIIVHAHITLADFEGKAFGGHLMPGTEIFAAEFQIQEYIGAELIRKTDETTGLPLWD